MRGKTHKNPCSIIQKANIILPDFVYKPVALCVRAFRLWALKNLGGRAKRRNGEKEMTEMDARSSRSPVCQFAGLVVEY